MNEKQVYLSFPKVSNGYMNLNDSKGNEIFTIYYLSLENTAFLHEIINKYNLISEYAIGELYKKLADITAKDQEILTLRQRIKEMENTKHESVPTNKQ